MVFNRKSNAVEVAGDGGESSSFSSISSVSPPSSPSLPSSAERPPPIEPATNEPVRIALITTNNNDSKDELAAVRFEPIARPESVYHQTEPIVRPEPIFRTDGAIAGRSKRIIRPTPAACPEKIFRSESYGGSKTTATSSPQSDHHPAIYPTPSPPCPELPYALPLQVPRPELTFAYPSGPVNIRSPPQHHFASYSPSTSQLIPYPYPAVPFIRPEQPRQPYPYPVLPSPRPEQHQQQPFTYPALPFSRPEHHPSYAFPLLPISKSNPYVYPIPSTLSSSRPEPYNFSIPSPLSSSRSEPYNFSIPSTSSSSSRPEPYAAYPIPSSTIRPEPYNYSVPPSTARSEPYNYSVPSSTTRPESLPYPIPPSSIFRPEPMPYPIPPSTSRPERYAYPAVPSSRQDPYAAAAAAAAAYSLLLSSRQQPYACPMPPVQSPESSNAAAAAAYPMPSPQTADTRITTTAYPTPSSHQTEPDVSSSSSSDPPSRPTVIVRPTPLYPVATLSSDTQLHVWVANPPVSAPSEEQPERPPPNWPWSNLITTTSDKPIVTRPMPYTPPVRHTVSVYEQSSPEALVVPSKRQRSSPTANRGRRGGGNVLDTGARDLSA